MSVPNDQLILVLFQFYTPVLLSFNVRLNVAPVKPPHITDLKANNFAAFC